MSIDVSAIQKSYTGKTVLGGISFTATPGRVLGILGPNGAGKSTTMKIIAGSLRADSGSVSVCGIDMSKNSLAARRNIGYLPENNPLYHDMYVLEALDFLAGLHGVKDRKTRVSEVIAMTGLAPEQHKKIAQLSKGYRQRVGLAQAILHNPAVLILDEPTTGLDPNQLVDIRNLIKTLGNQKTVLLSTHIMQEVTAICDDVIIIHRGRIIAGFPMDEFATRYPNQQLEDLFNRLTAKH